MKASESPIRVLMADDHQLVLDGIRLMISEAEDMECVDTANSGEEVLDKLREKGADVLLLDINMPGMNGVETCRAAHIRHPELRIIALSMLKEPSVIKLMLKNGASGYLLKNTGREEVLNAIRKVHAGQQYYSQEVSQVVMASLTDPSSRSKPEPPLFPQLTRREKQILKLILEEQTTGEIADALSIKFGTVETHRRNLLLKLGARNTAGLVRVALEYRLLED
jgi:DNA-binding NarL/FixJ family response regulator